MMLTHKKAGGQPGYTKHSPRYYAIFFAIAQSLLIGVSLGIWVLLIVRWFGGGL